MRGDFCSGRFSGEGVEDSVQYPCCLDGAAYTCALNTRGQGGQSMTEAVEVSKPGGTATASDDHMETRSSASTTTITSNSDLERTAGGAGLLIAAPRPTITRSAAATSGVEGPRNIVRGENGGDTFAMKLTSALVDGAWIARSSSGAGDAEKKNDVEEKGGEDASWAACELYLQLDDDTGDITAVPTIATTNQSADKPNEDELNQAEARRRCGILVASGKQAGDNSPTVVFAFVSSDNGGEASDEKVVIVRRGRTQLLTRTTSTTGSDDSMESAGARRTRATLAILWQPASPDDGEEDGEGGAYSEAWVKKTFD